MEIGALVKYIVCKQHAAPATGLVAKLYSQSWMLIIKSDIKKANKNSSKIL